MTSNSQDKRNTPPIRFPLWVLAILAVVLLIVVIISAAWLFRTVQDIASATISDSPEFAVPQDGIENVEVVGDVLPEDNSEQPLPVVIPDEIQPWSGEERINFLFMGVDLRCDEDGPSHTDSIMIVTIDPLTMSAALLSLPRDLWVEIPGFGVDRINQAYYFGQAYEYPGGGQALAMETVEALYSMWQQGAGRGHWPRLCGHRRGPAST